MVSLYKCYRDIDIVITEIGQYNKPKGEYMIYTLLCI